jgi:beta-1,4-mannooligosaccharide/beta-1,4-mannosyl-N-acetylglucosamine phosphorylase
MKYSVITNSNPEDTAAVKIPWQDRPAGFAGVMWRYDHNPIIPRDLIPCANSIFNSAVVPYKGAFAGVFRADSVCRNMRLHNGRSDDGINFQLDHEPIKWVCDEPEIGEFVESYDPRVCWIEDRYYITWCNNYYGYTIGVGYTYDFKTFYQMENAFLPFNRNGVLFPRKINGRFVMLSRPSDTGHTPFGDIFCSQSPDMVHWGCHRHVMSPKKGRLTWECTKIGPGPVPIETSEGWLMIYHGVMTSCNGFNYSIGAAILDIDEPWKVKYRARPYLLNPREIYECVGDVPNVVFPCANIVEPDTGRMAIYYGCADTVTGLAFCNTDELIDFVKENSEL